MRTENLSTLHHHHRPRLSLCRFGETFIVSTLDSFGFFPCTSVLTSIPSLLLLDGMGFSSEVRSVTSALSRRSLNPPLRLSLSTRRLAFATMRRRVVQYRVEDILLLVVTL